MMLFASCDGVTTSGHKKSPNPNLPEPTPLSVDVSVQPLDLKFFEAIDYDSDGKVTREEVQTFQETAKAIEKEVQEEVEARVENQTPTVKVNWIGPVVVTSVIAVFVIIISVVFGKLPKKSVSQKENDGVLHTKEQK